MQFTEIFNDLHPIRASYFNTGPTQRNVCAPTHKRQAPKPARAAPYGQAISVSDGQSLSLRPIFTSELGFAPDARLRLTMLSDEPLDGTSRSAYLHTIGKRVYASLFA